MFAQKTGLVALLSFLLASNYSITWQRNRIHGHPLLSCIVSILIAGIVLQLFSRVYPVLAGFSRYRGRTLVSTEDDAEENHNITKDDDNSPHQHESERTPPLTPRQRRQAFLVSIGCFVLRIFLFGAATNEPQCYHTGVEITLLPALLLLHDLFYTKRPSKSKTTYDVDEMSKTIYDDIAERFIGSQTRYVFATSLFCTGVYLTAAIRDNSNVICLNAENRELEIAFHQISATFLDAVVICLVLRLLRDSNSAQNRRAIITNVSLFSSIICAALAFLYTLFNGSLGGNLASFFSGPRHLYSAVQNGLSLAFLLFSADCLLKELRGLVFICTAVFFPLYASIVTDSWATRNAFPPHLASSKMIALSFLFFGFAFIVAVHNASEARASFAKRVPIWFYALLYVAFASTQVIYLLGHRFVGFHPIGWSPNHSGVWEKLNGLDFLMYEARVDSDRWLKQASSSQSLRVAVSEYRNRYHQSPPPNFDKWYEFAQQKGSLILEDFDSIERDLAPFWGIEPAVIRDRTGFLYASPDVAMIQVRNRRASVSLKQADRNLWVDADTVSIINSFAQWLPDMDIAINLQDNPQVAIPYELAAKASRSAEENRKKNLEKAKDNKFSLLENPGWPQLGTEPDTSEFQSTDGKHKSGMTVGEVVRQACPPKSSTRKGKLWNTGDFCIRCSRPHSVGQFIRSWSNAADLCHQPDIDNLHGFIMSPDEHTWPLSKKDILIPLFSRRKTQGFNDILFPGPTDYFIPGTVQGHEKPFGEKDSSLFWRGDADEEFSEDGKWQGMMQQRLVKLANNPTYPVTLLLPYPGEKLVYEQISVEQAKTFFRIDTGFTSLKSCAPTDCQTQETTFRPILGMRGPAEDPSNYRYVMSLDTALTIPIGNTPSFLEILQSTSLPFRASIFRSWYDDRLMPWLHFVPIDIRLYDLHSTLAYFTGLRNKDGVIGDVVINERELRVEGKEDQAAFIADQGSKWAEKTMRREDAEVYFFRLLLEWGRIMDDNREEIGFVLDE